MTPAEKILWQELRANKLGVHFRRQQEDARREKVLREMRLWIVRFRNEDVDSDLLGMIGKIQKLVA